METDKVINYIETSFLQPILKMKNITDVSYNGESIFYVDNMRGRQKSNIVVTYTQAKDFLRQIANLCEKQFSYLNPVLDVSAGKYRINAVHQTIARRGNDATVTFCMRIASNELKISPNTDFMPAEVAEILDSIISANKSLVIGGITGSGKTELQKYLISRMPMNTRIVAIDNVLELDYQNIYGHLDINTWQIDEKQTNYQIQTMVRNALRNNPDWIIVAESRGSEMLEVLNSTMTGHPIITTMHAFDVESMIDRLTNMVMMNDKDMSFEQIKKDVQYHIRFYVYLKKESGRNGSIKRYISSICYQGKNSFTPIYKSNGKTKKVYRLTNEIKQELYPEMEYQNNEENLLEYIG